MRAWLMERFDGIDALRLGDVADPRPGPADVLLAIRTAALNPADAFLARGLYPARPPLPHVLGRDGSGTVLDVGSDVTGVRKGDLVGILRCHAGVETWGTFAEQVVVPAASVVPVPDGWSSEEMAGAPLVFLTAWQALTQWSQPPAPPRAGTRLVVSGASGGVGVATILLARSMGLRIVGLSRSEEKAAALRRLGADATFHPTDPDLKKHVVDAAGGRIDLVVDTVAGALFPTLVSMLNDDGRGSVVGRSGGDVPAFNTATLFFRRIRIGGVAVGDYTPDDARDAWQQIVTRLAGIGARPVVDRTYPFDELKAAFERLERGPLGKVLLQVQEPAARARTA